MFIADFPPSLHISLSTHSSFCSSHSESRVYSNSLVTCPRLFSFSLALIHQQERQQGISDSHCGSVDWYSAVCVCESIVFVCETEGRGSCELMRGKPSRHHSVLGSNDQRQTSRRASFTNSELMNETHSRLRRINYERISAVSKTCFRKSLKKPKLIYRHITRALQCLSVGLRLGFAIEVNFLKFDGFLEALPKLNQINVM